MLLEFIKLIKSKKYYFYVMTKKMNELYIQFLIQ